MNNILTECVNKVINEHRNIVFISKTDPHSLESFYQTCKALENISSKIRVQKSLATRSILLNDGILFFRTNFDDIDVKSINAEVVYAL